MTPLDERVQRLRGAGRALYGLRDGVPNRPRIPFEDRLPTRRVDKSAGAASPSNETPGKQPLPAAVASDRSSADQPPLGSVSELNQARAAGQTGQQQEIDSLVQKAQAAEAAGKPGQAKIFYQQAARRAPSPLKEQLLQRAAFFSGATRSPAPPSKTP